MSDTTFRTVLRGYEPTEVDHYVQSLRDATEAARVAAAERTVELEKTRAQHSQALGETEQLRQRVARLEENSKTAAPPSFAELGERIGKILTLAQEESAQLRAAARSEADRVLEEAQSKSNRVISQAQAQADEAISRTDAEVARRLSDAQRRADEILDIADREAAARREEAEAVYERQRARAAAAATEFETTLAERRDNAAAEFARALAGHDQSLAAAEEKLAAVEKEAETRKADSEREADHLLSGAREDAEHIVREARETAEKVRRESERELAAASHQREAITAQLSNVRQMLATIGGGAGGAMLDAVVGTPQQEQAEPVAAEDQGDGDAPDEASDVERDDAK